MYVAVLEEDGTSAELSVYMMTIKIRLHKSLTKFVTNECAVNKWLYNTGKKPAVRTKTSYARIRRYRHVPTVITYFSFLPSPVEQWPVAEQ